MADLPRKRTLSSRIAAHLREAILRGEMEPGAKINLDRLREAHGISISPLREAVARLVADGLVEFEDQRGYRVAPVSSADLAEVTRLRAELEAIALEASIERGDLDWESDVMRALHRLTRTARDPDAREAADAEFHAALIGACGMPLLLRICAQLGNMTARYRHLFPGPDREGRDPPAEQEAIARAATARDAATAVAALRAHVLRTGGILQENLASAARMPERPTSSPPRRERIRRA